MEAERPADEAVEAQGPVQGSAGAAPQQQGEAEQPKPMSKSQQKKLAKRERLEEQKRLRKEQSKQARQAKAEQRRAEGRERMATMNEQEKAQWQAERRARVDARRQEAEGKKAKLHKALAEGQRVVVDLDFEDKMTDTEIRSLCQQLAYAYGENTRAAVPCHLALTSLKGSMLAHVRRQLAGFDNWLATKSEEGYLEHYAGEKDALVYLTADSPSEITELDPSMIYIIGGLVDRNRHKGICLRKAEEQGIQHGRLPIGEYMKLASSQVMTTNHVVHIILKWLELRDWEAAFNAVVPPRKRKRADGDGESDEEQQEQQQQQPGEGGAAVAEERSAGAAPQNGSGIPAPDGDVKAEGDGAAEAAAQGPAAAAAAEDLPAAGPSGKEAEAS